MSFQVDAGRLARSRFALSRLFEVTNALEVIARPERAPYAGNWVTQARRKLDLDRVRVLFELVNAATWYIPDFLSPLPQQYEPSLDEELATVAATPPDDVRAQLRQAFRIGSPPPAASAQGTTASDPRAPLPGPIADALARGGEESLVEQVVDQLAVFWHTIMSDLWETLHRVLDEDVRHRATVATRVGFADIVGGLHPALGWDGKRVTLDAPVELFVDATPGLILAPSAFLPRPAVYLDPPDRVMVGYPARARGQVWSMPGSGAELADIVGVRRAALLADLDIARTTAELAIRHRLSPATVSYHLGRLLRAGLVVRRRDGHRVLYQRTRPAAEALRALQSSRQGVFSSVTTPELP